MAVDVRIVAATNQPLEELIEQRRFRADLYYRLNVVPLSIPPLRERQGDILPLAYYISGLPFDCIQAAATWLFLWFGAEPMLEKLDRVKVKYGMVER